MYLLQEAIAGGPMLLAVILGAIVLGGICIVLLFQLFKKKKDDGRKEEAGSESESVSSTGVNRVKNIVNVILIGLLLIIIVKGCNWVCNFKYD